MIRTSRFGAIAFIAATSFLPPALAQSQASAIGGAAHLSDHYAFTRVNDYSARANGGGSTGYNERATGPNWHLKKHSQARNPQPASETAPK
jgi:hypothetical protein